MAGWQGYNDWLKKVNDSGMYFSDWDLQRAANDENYANQAYNIKSGWYGAQAAGDQAGMDKYHTDMENLRAGTNFSGGQYGDEYHPWDDGSAQAKPTYTAPAASSKPTYSGTTTPRPSWDADGSVSAALNAAAEEDPEQLLKSVRGAVDAFVKDAEQFDDLTMLCLEYRGKENEKHDD